MKYNENMIARSQEITKIIQNAEKTNQPIDHYLVKEQIDILEASHDEFVRQANEQGIDNLSRARIEVQLYSGIKTWCKKIDLPTDKYDKAIHDIRVKFFGEENGFLTNFNETRK